MTAASAHLTAVQRAQAAYQEMLQRRRDAALARLKRERRKNVRLALVSVFAIAGALAFGLHYGFSVSPHSAAQAKNKPVDPFVATRVGHIRTPYKREYCQQVEFDNKTGKLIAQQVVLCDGYEPGPGGASSPEAKARFNSLRDAFKR